MSDAPKPYRPPLCEIEHTGEPVGMRTPEDWAVWGEWYVAHAKESRARRLAFFNALIWWVCGAFCGFLLARMIL